ncbi:MAG: ABC transporter permease [Bryobacteraceae bacterium]|jgi:putative ABC transport system permease protein
MIQDIRYAVRTMFANPGFAVVAVLALALGIGPNSAIFSMVSAALLRPLPLRDADRVVSLWEKTAKIDLPLIVVSEANYLDWKRQSRSFEKTGTAFAFPEYGVNVVAGREPQRVPAGKASAAFFDIIGMKPLLGREFTAEEDLPGGPGVALVSEGFWRSELHGDPSAIGRRLTIDGLPRTVVGVLPNEKAMFLGRIDIWTPMAMDPNSTQRTNRNRAVFARLKPGVTLAQAQAEMTGIAQRLARQYPAADEGWGVVVVPMNRLVTGLLAPPLMILLGAVGLLLLLACANVANLLLARAAGRQREIAIRAALGAGRLRIVRQLLTESVILSLMGGACGLLLAQWSIGLLRGIMPDALPRMQQMSIDGNVLAFTFAVALLTGILFGAAPAIRTSKADLNDALRASGRTLTGGGTQGIRDGLVVAEIALALVLAVAAGLLSHSFIRLMSVDPGLRTKDLLTMQLTVPTARYPEEEKRKRYFRNVVERVQALPGVESAGAISFLPFRQTFLTTRVEVDPFRVPDQPVPREGQEPLADLRVITPGFFTAMGIPLHHGRDFDSRDTGSAPRVIIINEAMARRHLAGGNPVGKRLQLQPWNEPAREIVGVVADVKLYGLDQPVEPAAFLPYAQKQANEFESMSLVVHSGSEPGALTAAIRREVRSLDAEQPIADVRPMRDVVADSTILRRVAMGLIGVFAVLALVLATVGTYGLTVYSVSQRTHEIGLRMALGARDADVLRHIVGRSAILAGIGVGLGTAGALGVARILKGFLFGITSGDPLILVGIPGALLAIAVLASYLPARRALKVDPMEALRYD